MSGWSKDFRQKVSGFVGEVKRVFGVEVAVEDVLGLLEEAYRIHLEDKNMKGEAKRVFGSACVHAVYGYTNDCKGVYGVFRDIYVLAHDARYGCNTAPGYVVRRLWCG